MRSVGVVAFHMLQLPNLSVLSIDANKHDRNGNPIIMTDAALKAAADAALKAAAALNGGKEEMTAEELNAAADAALDGGKEEGEQDGTKRPSRTKSGLDNLRDLSSSEVEDDDNFVTKSKKKTSTTKAKPKAKPKVLVSKVLVPKESVPKVSVPEVLSQHDWVEELEVEVSKRIEIVSHLLDLRSDPATLWYMSREINPLAADRNRNYQKVKAVTEMLPCIHSSCIFKNVNGSGTNVVPKWKVDTLAWILFNENKKKTDSAAVGIVAGDYSFLVREYTQELNHWDPVMSESRWGEKYEWAKLETDKAIRSLRLLRPDVPWDRYKGSIIKLNSESVHVSPLDYCLVEPQDYYAAEHRTPSWSWSVGEQLTAPDVASTETFSMFCCVPSSEGFEVKFHAKFSYNRERLKAYIAATDLTESALQDSVHCILASLKLKSSHYTVSIATWKGKDCYFETVRLPTSEEIYAAMKQNYCVENVWVQPVCEQQLQKQLRNCQRTLDFFTNCTKDHAVDWTKSDDKLLEFFYNADDGGIDYNIKKWNLNKKGNVCLGNRKNKDGEQLPFNGDYVMDFIDLLKQEDIPQTPSGQMSHDETTTLLSGLSERQLRSALGTEFWTEDEILDLFESTTAAGERMFQEFYNKYLQKDPSSKLTARELEFIFLSIDAGPDFLVQIKDMFPTEEMDKALDFLGKIKVMLSPEEKDKVLALCGENDENLRKYLIFKYLVLRPGTVFQKSEILDLTKQYFQNREFLKNLLDWSPQHT